MASFAYDAAGRRVSRTAGGVTTSFLYDGESVLLEQQGGATTASYAYGNALTRKDGETPLFDGLGSERTVTNAGGAVQATLTLSAFGQTIASSGGSTSAYQYAATSRYRNDGDAGLALVGCRYYDAQVGQFITRDTVLTEKPYAYCDADPVNATDPSGHSALPVVAGIFGAIALGIVAVALLPVDAPVLVIGIVGASGALVGGTGAGAVAGGVGGKFGTGDTFGSGGAEGFGAGVLVATLFLFKQIPKLFARSGSGENGTDDSGDDDGTVWPPPPTA